jgi:hypothetical protein
VEPRRFEHLTFPVSPGPAHRLFDVSAILLFFDLRISTYRFATQCILFGMDQIPGTTIFQRSRMARIVMSDTLIQILRLSHLIALR